jgi:hypothetical protein
MSNFSVQVNVFKVADHFVAGTKMAGFTIRGKLAKTEGDAARNLLWKLAGQDNDDDAFLAVDLAAQGTTLDEQLALSDGGDGGA